mmetsp:Transcript_35253/g.64464  ORF Transcript_35253/g.64464 Transcript_35253/m.64464 type:complete len:480 (-) Transcript_35253:65-1504(-)
MVNIISIQLIDADAAANLEETQRLLGSSDGKSASSSVRCVDSKHVLKGLAKVFAENSKPATESEAEALYGLSQETDTVDHFISHSWSAGRYKKWAAISDYYYRSTAVVCANSVALALAFVGYQLRGCMDGPMMFSDAFLVWTCVPGAVILGSVALGHIFLPHFGSSVFLDRLCIHQWDDDLKQLGVRSLGDVLLKSKKMMVLWSEDYMERLWCIFEIATFSAHKEPADMVFIPLWMTPFLYTVLFGAMLMLFLASLMQELGVMAPVFIPFLDVFNIKHGRNFAVRFILGHGIPSLPVCYFIRRAVRQKTSMLQWVATFRLDDTKLTVEHDRAFIYDHINRLFGSKEHFEQFVRNDVLRSLHKVIGEAWVVPYAWGMFAFQPYLWYVTTDSMSTPAEVVDAYGWSNWEEYFFLNLLWYVPFYLLMPLVLKAVAISSYCTLRWPCGIGLLVDVWIFLSLVMLLALVCWEPVLQSPLFKRVA